MAAGRAGWYLVRSTTRVLPAPVLVTPVLVAPVLVAPASRWPGLPGERGR
jgi:hypothetical protein